MRLLGAAHFEAGCPFCSALFSGCLSLLLVMTADTDKLTNDEYWRYDEC